MIMKSTWKAALTAAVLTVATAAGAQTYPTQSVTLVVPFAPGAALDTTGRMVAESLSEFLGQSVVVENRPGAAGNIGYSSVAKAPNDGYTVLLGYSATSACSPSLYPDLGWNPVKDFRPIAGIVRNVLMLTVHLSVPANTLPEFVEYLKQHPGEINYGSAGIGSLSHIAAEEFARATGTEMTHVPYKGAGELMADFLSGTLQFALLGASPIRQHVDSGKIKALAVAGMSRDRTLPDVPTTEEMGVPGFKAEGWIGLFVPAGTPNEVVEKLANGMEQVAGSVAFSERVVESGLEVQYFGPEAMASRVLQDLDECSDAIERAGITRE